MKVNAKNVKKLQNFKKLVLVVETQYFCLREIKILESHVKIRFQLVECLVKKYNNVVTNAQEVAIKVTAQTVK